MEDEKKIITPEEIAEVYKDNFELIELIREYGEQQRQQGIIEGFQNIANWATFNIDGLKDNNENLVV